MNIYLGNLNYKVREGEIQQVLEEYGAVSSIKIVKDHETGRSKGFEIGRASCRERECP